ncbi:MAG: ATP-binding cassette domain-containing protein [Frankiaceae bacterium]
MLEIRGLTKSYGSRVALDGVTYSVRPGEMFGFVGPNGAGKTTTMRIVLGVLAADAGSVHWAGRPLDAATRARFGYMPEERGLYPKMRVGDQLSYLAALHGLPAATARAAALRWATELGLAERLGEPVEKLSLGNQQRVQLAAALVHDPDLLVLDEPFSGLDPVGVDVLAGVLARRVSEGAAVVFSSHQLELVERLCEVVGIIVAGKMVATGPVEELRHRGTRPRWRVDGPPPGWVRTVAGARVIDVPAGAGNRGVVVELDQGADPTQLLDAARAAGPVTHFAAVEPSLAEVFRDAVSAR